ncbi:hypothetical protein RND81_12G145500 [Saponaria officinalis]|uniref:Uncharacterized protein n=1 Tax=Saponaria officinalis TaxID=3572 RepID=A0AAW1HAQ5_SAPOF
MGGCASRPKDLDTNEPAPVQAPVVDKPESQPIAQENNGGEETKTEEPLVDLSEPKGETAESSETKPTEEATDAAAEAKTEKVAEVVAEVVAEAKTEVAPPAAEVAVVAAEPVKEEAKPVEAQKTEDNKSDAPVVSV